MLTSTSDPIKPFKLIISPGFYDRVISLEGRRNASIHSGSSPVRKGSFSEMSLNEEPVRIIAKRRNISSTKENLSFETLEQKQSNISLEEIITTLWDSIIPYLDETDKANLLATNSALNKCYFIPLDLFRIQLSYKDFQRYFRERPETNLIGLNIYFGLEDDDMTPLLPFLPRLRRLKLHNTKGMAIIMSHLKVCINLEELVLNISVINLQPLPNLLKLVLHCDVTGTSEYLSKYTDLRHLVVYNNLNPLQVLEGIANLKMLERISLYKMFKLTQISPLEQITNLEVFEVYGCENLTDISGLTNCKQLKHCIMQHCDKLRNFSPLSSCTSLEVINLSTNNPMRGPVIELDLNLFIDPIHLTRLEVRN
jgi:hypothetical protein